MELSVNSTLADNMVMLAKTYPEEPYESGPISVDTQDTFWILTQICHDSQNEEDVIKNLRVSMNIIEESEKVSKVQCTVSADNIEPKVYEIAFQSELVFKFNYLVGSAYEYSSKYGLSSDHSMVLAGDIMDKKGVLIGFDSPNGEFPGGDNHVITFSIKLEVIRYGCDDMELSDLKVVGIKNVIERLKNDKSVPYKSLVEKIHWLAVQRNVQNMVELTTLYEELCSAILQKYPGLICVANIEHFLDTKRIRIVKIEESSGLRQGYFSRLKKKWERGEGTPDPDLKFIMTIARECGITLDDMFTKSIIGLSDDNMYTKKVLDKLYYDTIEKRLSWIKNDKSDSNESCEYKAELPNTDRASVILSALIKKNDIEKVSIHISNGDYIDLSTILEEKRSNSLLFIGGKKLYQEITNQSGANRLRESDKKILDMYLNM